MAGAPAFPPLALIDASELFLSPGSPSVDWLTNVVRPVSRSWM